MRIRRRHDEKTGEKPKAVVDRAGTENESGGMMVVENQTSR